VTLNAVVVLSLVAAMLGGMVSVILRPDPWYPFATLGALAFGPCFLAFGVVVWLSVFRRSELATGAATVVYFVAAALAVFGVAANVAEAILDGTQAPVGFIACFAGGGVLMAADAVFCGFLSLRWLGHLRKDSPRDASHGMHEGL
jgi:hypothetical protein